MQHTVPVAGHSKFAASLNKPLKNFSLVLGLSKSDGASDRKLAPKNRNLREGERRTSIESQRTQARKRRSQVSGEMSVLVTFVALNS